MRHEMIALTCDGAPSPEPGPRFPRPAGAQARNWRDFMDFVSNRAGFVSLIVECLMFYRRFAALRERWSAVRGPVSIATGIAFLTAF